MILRAHAWIAGQVPSGDHVRGNHTLMFLSLSPSLPLSLKKEGVYLAEEAAHVQQYVSCNVFIEGEGSLVLDQHEANDDKLDLTDYAEFVQSNPELHVLSLVLHASRHPHQLPSCSRSMQVVPLNKQITIIDSPSFIVSPLNSPTALALRSPASIEVLRPVEAASAILSQADTRQVKEPLTVSSIFFFIVSI